MGPRKYFMKMGKFLYSQYIGMSINTIRGCRRFQEIGRDNGLGYNINVCWSHAGMRDIDYNTVWDHLLIPIMEEFKPDIILISAGFDAALGDKLGECKVTPRGFAVLLHKLIRFGRIVMALEGGYNVDVMPNCVAESLKVMLGDSMGDVLSENELCKTDSLPYDTTWTTILRMRDKLKRYWKIFENDIPEEVISASTTYSEELEGHL